MAEINGQDLRHAGGPEGLNLFAPSALHRLKRSHVDGFNRLKEHFSHDTKGKDGDCDGAGEGAEREDQRARVR